tara:strand:- start:242 stop:457 length:216 start_codon:yes stop_codon:yes gene_type:complete
MTDQPLHKVHLESAQQQQKQLVTEVQELQNQINAKKELILKVQGVIEYLGQLENVPVPQEDPVPEAPETTE